MKDSAAVAVSDDKRPQVETLLADVFKLMEYPATLDFKDMADGSLGVACHFEGELPGITAGKRSLVVDSVQFWVNKVVNRPNVPRRWVNLGVNAFPEPRSDKPAPVEKPVAAPAPAAKPVAAKAAAAPGPAKDKRAEPERRSSKVDERQLDVPADPVITALGKELAEKSAKYGRFYGVLGLTNEQRALMLKAGDAVPGVKLKAEGEGHWRRLVTLPEKVTVIPKKQVMPDYDDEEDE